MRICHLNILWTLDPGVLRKLSHQALALHKAAGSRSHADCLVVIRQEAVGKVPADPLLTLFPISVPGPALIQEALLPFLVWPKLKNHLKQYDAIVTRWPIPTPSFLKAVQSYKIFTEHHSKELDEIALTRGLKPFMRRIWEKRCGPRILRAAQGIIGVTDEIRRYELERAGVKRPSLVLPNGISVADIPFKRPAIFDGKTLDLAFVSSQFSPWQGLDRLLEGMRAWGNSRSPKLNLHLIGIVTEEQKATIQRMGLAEMVRIHGVLYGSDLDEVISSCHLAIGSLAINRKGLREACALKVREYTARGLPFVISHDDPDLPARLPWVLKIPADESPVEIDALVNFAEKVGRLATLATEMRNYAEKKLSWDVKMKCLVNFVQDNI